MSGQLIMVVGPSGAGKDTVVDWVMAHWQGPPTLHWARRTITRPPQSGGEPHESLNTAHFEAQLARGDFALHWTAHGLHYGVRHAELQGLAQGHWVLVTGSRNHLAQARAQHPGLRVLHITAHPDTLRQRLGQRQRETSAEIEARVQRNARLAPPLQPGDMEMSNDGPLADTGQAVLRWLQQLHQGLT